MLITRTLIVAYVDFINDGVITKERLLDFIKEREDCSTAEAEEIKSWVIDELNQN